MKVVKARIPDSFYRMLRRESRRTGRSMQDIVSEALQARLLFTPLEDPFLSGFPIGRSRGRGKADIGARHDEILYGTGP
ncbi:MAG TPA: hypothetical protein VGR51_03240 [Thermoplasmata archaeon]|jgi:hypothetical protein|nr:hypothetical protein [Thermoplasmata archaeon]